ncbi:hypothetical protein HGH93_21370 [Chitinophaga polysaccharea]|uniref:hypothetical protein n=1 Tax=Chitinophaga polysaccharea TaxID=1293035 RepID=UPI001455D016|nr:hypothetical protein [Chitinophaga polysaccharea]NLR60674.1 hypothetical protein [Chitinophaga polysaccharea]
MTEKDCGGCKYIKGDECLQYNGTPMDECGLVNGQWYNIDELIAALKCAGFSTTTTSSTTVNPGTGGCISVIVEAYNNIYEPLGLNPAELTYKLYETQESTVPFKEKNISMGQADIYTRFEPLNAPDGVYVEVNAIVSRNSEGRFLTSGSSLDLIIIANDIIRYARSIAIPKEGNNFFSDIPVLPKGRIVIVLFKTQFDSLNDNGQGLIAMGGIKLDNSFFQAEITMNEGGTVGVPTIIWPDPDSNISGYVYSDYDTEHWGVSASSMDIKISGLNNEPVPVKVEFSATSNPELGFTDVVAQGQAYNRTIGLTKSQADNNDFLIRILK